jgi:fatty acid desaturase
VEETEDERLWIEKQRIYERNRDQLLAQDLSNAQSHDKAVLTLAAGALGLSISMLKWFGVAVWPDLLVWSWACFVLAIIAVIASFLVGQSVIGKRIDALDIAHHGSAEPTRSHTEHCAECLRLANNLMNWVSGGAFIVGVIFLTVFAYLNMKG